MSKSSLQIITFRYFDQFGVPSVVTYQRQIWCVVFCRILLISWVCPVTIWDRFATFFLTSWMCPVAIWDKFATFLTILTSLNRIWAFNWTRLLTGLEFPLGLVAEIVHDTSILIGKGIWITWSRFGKRKKKQTLISSSVIWKVKEDAMYFENDCISLVYYATLTLGHVSDGIMYLMA